MRKLRFLHLSLLSLLLLSLPLFGQTTTYHSTTGTITPSFIATMNLDAGGAVTVYVSLPGCYYPGPCGSTSSRVNYSLADGSMGSFYPVALTFQSVAGTYYGTYKIETTGPLSGTDTNGNPVTVTDVTFFLDAVLCHQPRGTCAPKKVYDSGDVTITR